MILFGKAELCERCQEITLQMGRKPVKERWPFPCSENDSITSRELPGATRKRKKPIQSPWSLWGQHDLANLLLWGFWPQEYENKLPLLKVTYVTAVPGIGIHSQSVAESEEKERSQEVLWEAAGAIGAPLVSPLLLLFSCLHSQTKVFPQNSSKPSTQLPYNLLQSV